MRNKFLVALLIYYVCWPNEETTPYSVKYDLINLVERYTIDACFYRDRLNNCRENRLFFGVIDKE
jgi:hypothetical protein